MYVCNIHTHANTYTRRHMYAFMLRSTSPACCINVCSNLCMHTHTVTYTYTVTYTVTYTSHTQSHTQSRTRIHTFVHSLAHMHAYTDAQSHMAKRHLSVVCASMYVCACMILMGVFLLGVVPGRHCPTILHHRENPRVRYCIIITHQHNRERRAHMQHGCRCRKDQHVCTHASITHTAACIVPMHAKSTHTQTHTHSHIHTFTHTRTHPPMHTCTHTHAYTYTHIYTHTRTFPLAHSHTHPTCIQAENLHTTLVPGTGTPMQQRPTGIMSSRSVLADRCIWAF